MSATFELSTNLASAPDTVWAQVKRPALFLHVAAPLVRFSPIGDRSFPEEWSEREYRGSMRLLGSSDRLAGNRNRRSLPDG
ncbi:MAG: hypothetical protein AAGE86_06960 [Pseudomonadota bacterium]